MKNAIDRRFMRSLFVFINLIGLALTAVAVEPKYPPDVSQWKEISIPPASKLGAKMVWEYAANYSRHEWQVYAEDGQVRAKLVSPRRLAKGELPLFSVKGFNFGRWDSFKRVDDGWLVGFNRGEFGASLYWFSLDGKSHYKISDHQVVDFFSLPAERVNEFETPG